MKIIYRLGNLLDHSGRFISHGTNAQGVMGSGVAKSIRALYPRCYDVYREAYDNAGLHLGQVVVADCGRFVFLNGVTQEFYGGDGKVYVDYDAMQAVMRTCNTLLKLESPTPELAMPLIGAGLAGGDWAIISQIIEEESTGFQPVVYMIDPVQYAKITNGV
jgi:O-acetyl-ADP-ribose deacetylase (regulator of RNase III)